MKLTIGAFGTADQLNRANQKSAKVDLIDAQPNLEALKAYVAQFQPDDVLLIVNAEHALMQGNAVGYLGEFEVMDADIVFAASAAFRFDDPTLTYYFWKFYPRGKTNYHYLNSDAFIGRAGAISDFLDALVAEYPSDFSFHDLATRFYVECQLGAIETKLRVKLDTNQELFGCLDNRMSVVKWPMLSWMQADLFHRFEKKALLAKSAVDYRDRLWDVTYSKRRSFSFNGRLKTTPTIWLAQASATQWTRINATLQNQPLACPFSVLFASSLAYLKSLGSFFIAWLINRGETRPFRIFRYSANANPEWERVMQTFLGYLKRKDGFTFAHFNDGEMTFIKKYLEEDHAETWFGRRQQKYNKDLGQRLTDALRLQKERYHVGIPCSTSHPKLRKLADELVGQHTGVVPAMSLHHNLRYYPNILHELKRRECYFVMNDYQNLDVLKRLGVEVHADRVVKVPFKNSYLLYDELKDRRFPDGAVVILICGMLAKILNPVWFGNNPKVTFLALGSSLDDFIQRTNTKFRLYPKEGLPLTCNIQPTKFFAFGWKKECPECWTMMGE